MAIIDITKHRDWPGMKEALSKLDEAWEDYKRLKESNIIPDYILQVMRSGTQEIENGFMKRVQAWGEKHFPEMGVLSLAEGKVYTGEDAEIRLLIAKETNEPLFGE